jgi:synaptojanin
VGTNSTISKVSKDNKEGFMGKISHKMMNVQRFWKNSLGENFQQNSIDIILGKHVKSQVTSELRNYLANEMEKRKDDYSELKNINLLIGTWNIGGIKLYDSVDISSWVFPVQNHFIP